MQFIYTATSPFARKVNMVIHVLGIKDNVEYTIINPLEDPKIRDLNPLGKVPALVDGGKCLIDSSLICEYLDDHQTMNLFQKNSAHYYAIAQAHFLANGIMDAAVNSVFEHKRETEHSLYWLNRWDESIRGAIAQAQTPVLAGEDDPNIATVAMACALGYLDFRLPNLDWRTHNPSLEQWFKTIEKCFWYVKTCPPQ